MGFYDADDLPVFNYLADFYLIVNRWYSSIPGPTPPNRTYAYAGTSYGDTHAELTRFLDTYSKAETVFSRLDERGIR